MNLLDYAKTEETLELKKWAIEQVVALAEFTEVKLIEDADKIFNWVINSEPNKK